MSFRSGLSQRTTLTGVFYSNSTTQTYSNTETNTSLLASLQYVQNFTNYFIYLTYLPLTNPAFQGTINGENITLSGNLSTPTIKGGTPPLTPSDDYAVSFTGSPTIQGQPIEYDIIGEIKMTMNKLPLNYLICDGSGVSTTAYPDLFNIIGYTYGGSGNTFNLPNFESKFPIGANFDNGAGNPTSNFAYGNGTTGAINTQTVSYTAPDDVSLLTKMPTHDHSIASQTHSHRMGMENITNVLFVSLGEGLFAPFVIENTVPVTNQIYPTTTGISVLDTGVFVQDIDPVSGLAGVNITPPYIAVKYAICFSQS
jgi:microcystin-dependent protein